MVFPQFKFFDNVCRRDTVKLALMMKHELTVEKYVDELALNDDLAGLTIDEAEEAVSRILRGLQQEDNPLDEWFDRERV